MIDATWLRSLGEERLGTLLECRADAAAPPTPESLAELADRLDQPRSVLAVLRRLDRPTAQVAEALAALGGEADRGALDRLLGVPTTADASEVAHALDILRDHALLTGEEQPALVGAARYAWESPLGLGPPAAEVLDHRTADQLRGYARAFGLKPAVRKADLLAQVHGALRDPDLVRRLVASAPATSRDLLHKVAVTGEPVEDAGHYVMFGGRQPERPWHWAIERCLLVRANVGLVMPAEPALALRGPDWTAPFQPAPPRAAVTPVPATAVAADSAATGSAFVRLVTSLLEEAGRTPIAVLKSGGVGTRELRRLAKRIGAAEPDIRLALAVSHRTGLLALTPEGGTPTTDYDEWSRGEPAARLAALLRAWWSLPYGPTGTPDAGWTPSGRADGAAQLRAAVVATAAGLSGPDQPAAVAEPASLADLVLWHRPLALAGPDPESEVLACWREAALLGVVGAGCVSAAGWALVAAGDLLAALADLGGTERRVVLQNDLTALVTGTPSAELTELLDRTADRESRGTASTWRFTPASVRRALDAGLSAESLLDELAGVVDGVVPQPLTYLVGDLARRHGAVRGQEVACCLRSDDTALLAELVADRRLRGLGLRMLAPTVLAGHKPLAETLAGLRAAGYAPVAESADGTPVVERIRPRRAATGVAPGKPTGRKATGRRGRTRRRRRDRRARRTTGPSTWSGRIRGAWPAPCSTRPTWCRPWRHRPWRRYVRELVNCPGASNACWRTRSKEAGPCPSRTPPRPAPSPRG